MLLNSIITAFKNLFYNKTETLFCSVCIIISTVCLLFVFTVTDYADSIINKELDNMGINGISAVSGAGNLNDDILNFINKKNYVKKASGVTTDTAKFKGHGKEYRTFAFGIADSSSGLLSINTEKGREFSNDEIVNNENVCLIDKSVNDELFDGDCLGKKIRIKIDREYSSFKIIGVCNSKSSFIKTASQQVIPYSIYIPYTVIHKLKKNSNFNQIIIDFNDNKIKKNSNRLKREVETEFKGLDFCYTNLSSQRTQITKTIETTKTVANIIGAFATVVSLISCICIMLVSTNQHKKEIIIKKTLGLSNFWLIVETVLQGIFLFVFSYIIGFLIINIMFYFVGYLYNMGIIVKINTAVSGLIISFLLGIFSSLPSAVKTLSIKSVSKYCY